MKFVTFLLIQLYYCRKTVKSAKNTFFDTCAQNSRRDQFSDIFAHTVVLSRKNVKSAKNTIWDICAHNSWSYEFCDIFVYRVVISRKTVKSAKSRFVTLVHRNRGDMSFLTFLFKQL